MCWGRGGARGFGVEALDGANEDIGGEAAFDGGLGGDDGKVGGRFEIADPAVSPRFGIAVI